jgi:hypothetical protein
MATSRAGYEATAVPRQVSRELGEQIPRGIGRFLLREVTELSIG